MSTLREILEEHVARGTVPGAVGVDGAPDGTLEIVRVGDLAPDAIVRIQSMTKPVLAAAVLRLVQSGRLGLDDPVETWLPELADRVVLRHPAAALDEVEPAERPITVRHLLTCTSGYGVVTAPCPLQEAMAADGTAAGLGPVTLGAAEWLRALSDLPLAFQPGTGWRYHHSFGILGILLSRVEAAGSRESLLSREIFGPLGMIDTGYTISADKAHRLPAVHRRDGDGGLVQVEPAADGFHVEPAPFDVSHSELVSTAADYAAFARMLANGGRHDGGQFLAPELVELMRTDQVPASVKTPDSFFPGFWDGTGWGFGVSVRTEGEHAGRFGWAGGLGTYMFIDRDASFRILLTQVEVGAEIAELFDDVT
ncbi:serine hydrolase [Microbacterium sp. SD291]|uniref:serine hydrolase domain-containing protein n=1 Tax=Microbacterium sp. SD291 TaxID=2782007 RepID=UPI001A97C412|nr:serine hydrolase domain-containing protein [Microbacterium sp. SD291]MBO0979508.1 beta-lactamase family protein [Microbacterium sp. SD291]